MALIVSRSRTFLRCIHFEHRKGLLRKYSEYANKLVLEGVDIGQPTPCTHPHLFESKQEATPGITHTEYASRRLNLLTSISEHRIGRTHDRNIVILTANEEKVMSNDIPYTFHQDADFLYLTGLNEPDAVAVLEFTRPGSLKFLLFAKPKDPHRELWDGAVAGQQAAVEYFNADEAFPISSLYSVLQDRYGNGDCCVWMKKTKGLNYKNEASLTKILSSASFRMKSLEDANHSLQMLRLIKSSAEANIMRKSASIGAKAFMEVMRNTRPGSYESHLHALLEFECKIMGAQFLSFPPVVAGGRRANTLHYIKNNQMLRDGDLILMDGGCEYNGYPSDITRTWPVNGKFSSAQKDLYEIVLNVQKECLKKCTFNVSINQLHNVMLDLLGKELQHIGFIDEDLSDIELQRAASKFCPHHLGHYLGMDTHDTPLLHRGLSLKVGMAFTLEPGLYIPHNALDVPHEYRGIGIRIEDDIIMTNGGAFVLTNELPKEVNDVEKLICDFKEKRRI